MRLRRPRKAEEDLQEALKGFIGQPGTNGLTVHPKSPRVQNPLWLRKSRNPYFHQGVTRNYDQTTFAQKKKIKERERERSPGFPLIRIAANMRLKVTGFK